MSTLQKLLAVLLAFVIAFTPLATLPVQADEATYTDLYQSAPWATDSILSARDLGFMTGDPSGEFRPHALITRQEMAVILTRVLQLETATRTRAFADVPYDHWANRHIAAVNDAGLMTGDGTRFRPEDPITREELAVLLVKASGGKITSTSLTTTDRTQVSPWARNYVATSMQMGLIRGDGVRFNPRDLAQRQAVAVLAVNLHNWLSTHSSVITNIANDGTATIDGVTYSTSERVRDIFRSINREVLTGAKIRVLTTGQEIVRVTYLELLNGGMYAGAGRDYSGHLALDGGNSVIDGSVVIGANYVSLIGLKIIGNLEITNKVESGSYGRDLEVQGTVVVGGGDTNGIGFETSTLKKILVQKEHVRVHLIGQCDVETVNTTASHSSVVSDTTTIQQMLLEENAARVEIDSNIIHLTVRGTQTKVKLLGTKRVHYLSFPTSRRIMEVLENYDSARILIAYLNQTANPSYLPIPNQPPIAALPPGTTQPTTGTVIPTPPPGWKPPVTTPPAPPTPDWYPPLPNTPPASTAVVTGTVYRSLTKLAQATVIVVRPDGTEATRATTDNKGEFSVTLPNGNYLCYADSADPDYADSLRVAITVTNGVASHTGFDLRLETPQIKGTLRLPNGNPIANARIKVFTSTGVIADTTNQAGQYAIGQLGFGQRYFVMIEHSLMGSYFPIVDYWVLNSTLRTLDYTLVSTQDGSPAQPLVNPFSESSTQLTGLAAGMKAVYFMRRQTVVGYAEVNADGTFGTSWYNRLPASAGDLTVYTVDMQGRISAPLIVAPIVQPTLTKVTGTMYYNSNFIPSNVVPRSPLIISNKTTGETVRTATTNDVGQFEVLLPDGVYLFKANVTANNHSPEVEVTVSGGVATPASLNLIVIPPMSNINASGTIRDTTAAPISGVTILITDTAAQVLTDGEGHYEVSNLADGRYTVMIYGKGLNYWDVWEVRGGEPITRDYTLNANHVVLPRPVVNAISADGKSFSGTVTQLQNDRPPANKIYFTQGTTIIGMADIDATGRFTTSFFEPKGTWGSVNAFTQNSYGDVSDTITVTRNGSVIGVLGGYLP